MQQLGETMTAQEFGLHLALEREEPLPAAQWQAVASIMAALANGPLSAPAKGRNWAAHDFMPELWADVTEGGNQAAAEAITVDQIMARARMAGMVH